ncbi:GTP 3',8-cyclase MoaA [Fusibacter bizertensis]
MIDQYGRKINYLRLSVTDRCNLRCQYCMPEAGIEKIEHAEILSLEEIDEIISGFVALGVDKIRITGGEPLVRKGIVTLVKKIKAHAEIKDLSLTTNGILLKEMAADLKAAGINRINISLDSLDPDRYDVMTRGGELKKVLEGIDEAIKVGMNPIKINIVLIDGFNIDEVVAFVNLTKLKGIHVRFIELMPIGEVNTWSTMNYISNTKILELVPELSPIEREDISSPANYYQIPGAQGTVGLISPISCKFCTNCNRIRMTADGKLKFCLHSNTEYDLKKVLNEKGDIKEFIQNSLKEKPLEHRLDQGEFITRNMVQVGG